MKQMPLFCYFRQMFLIFAYSFRLMELLSYLNIPKTQYFYKKIK